MKIDKILFTCNENAEYIDFWNSISKHYNRHGFNCKLFFLGDKSKYQISDQYGEVEQIQPVSNVPTRIQALWGKFYFTSTEPNTNWLIGDIDLYQINFKFFDTFNYIPSNCGYAHIHEHGYGPWRAGVHDLPGYYHLAKGSTFTELFNLHETFEQQVLMIKDSRKYGIGFNGKGWTMEGVDWEYQCCEENLSSEIIRKHEKELNFFGRTMGGYRLDRQNIHGNINKITSDIKSGAVFDMHCPRPYNTHKDRIELIASLS